MCGNEGNAMLLKGESAHGGTRLARGMPEGDGCGYRADDPPQEDQYECGRCGAVWAASDCDNGRACPKCKEG